MSEKVMEMMTVEDVAGYLRVAERTVYDWAQKGSIPCAKLGSAWRFRRSDIDQWLAEKFNRKAPTRKPAAGEIALSALLTPEQIHFFDRTVGKHEALEEIAQLFAHAPQVKDVAELQQGIFRREELMSTGIGLGIAVPHVRLDSVRDLAVAVGICREAVADYESLDNQPVRLIFMIAAGTGQHAQHVRLLAQIAARLKKPNLREAMLHAKSKDEVLLILAEGE